MPVSIAICDSVATEVCVPQVEFCRDHCAEAKVSGDVCPFERRPLLQELAARGVRLTRQRRAVVEIIQEARTHLDAVALLDLAQRREPQIDRATVYRTLDLLKQHRLIDQLDFMNLPHERHHYEVKTRREHVHLTCFECGAIDELSSISFERLKREIGERSGFDVQVARLELGGQCRACRNRSAQS